MEDLAVSLFTLWVEAHQGISASWFFWGSLSFLLPHLLSFLCPPISDRGRQADILMRKEGNGGSDGLASPQRSVAASPSGQQCSVCWGWAGEMLPAVLSRACGGSQRSTVGLKSCCPLPVLTSVSDLCRGDLCADPPPEAAVPPPSACHSTCCPNLRPECVGCSPHDGEGENPPGEISATPFQP